METSAFHFKYEDEDIFFESVRFGKSIYIYIGDHNRVFDDLTMAMPNPVVSTHLIGDKASDELSSFVSELTNSPVILAYGFPIANEKDFERFDFVKLNLRKIYCKK